MPKKQTRSSRKNTAVNIPKMNAMIRRNDGPGRPIKSLSEMLSEKGISGTKNFSGVITDEYLPELSMYNSPQVYDKMRRSDGTVAALLAAYMMPLRAAKWFVQPYDETEESLKMADFVHDNLWGYGNQTFDDFFRQALTFLIYGFSWFEKIFDFIDGGEFDGMLGWHHFAFRYQNTRLYWNSDYVPTKNGAKHRKLVSVTQLAPPEYRMIDIPVEKLLVFSLNKEGDNYDGISLLRAVHPHWKIKQLLYRMQAIGLERAGMGVPYARWLTQGSQAVIDAVTSILENLRIDDQAAVQFDGSMVDIGFLENHFDAVAFKDAIEHHDSSILKAGLAQFVNLGTRTSGSTGSYSLSQDQSQMFLDALNGEANYFASEFHIQATQQLINFNYGNVPHNQMPRLAHGDIGERAATKLAQALNSFAQYGFLTPDSRTENVLREFMDLPARDEDWRAEQANAALLQTVFPSGDGNAGGIKGQPANVPINQNKSGNVPQPGKAGTGNGVSGGVGKQQGSGNRKGFRRQPVAGAQVGSKTQLSERDYDMLMTDYLATVESLKHDALDWQPERPSIRAARTRRPYVIRS